jgi:hypothetical protein
MGVASFADAAEALCVRIALDLLATLRELCVHKLFADQEIFGAIEVGERAVRIILDLVPEPLYSSWFAIQFRSRSGPTVA